MSWQLKDINFQINHFGSAYAISGMGSQHIRFADDGATPHYSADHLMALMHCSAKVYIYPLSELSVWAEVSGYAESLEEESYSILVQYFQKREKTKAFLMFTLYLEEKTFFNFYKHVRANLLQGSHCNFSVDLPVSGFKGFEDDGLYPLLPSIEGFLQGKPLLLQQDDDDFNWSMHGRRMVELTDWN
ncbi:MAG: hypothetical protein ACO4AU_04145 [bacterium]|jgi:hypothetical protein